MPVLGLAAVAALAAWLAILILPARAWSTRERIAPLCDAVANPDLARVAVLIPARNEADAIPATLAALAEQGRNLEVVVVDDESDDRTDVAALEAHATLARSLDLKLIRGQPLPAGWGGKLWALEQGFARVNRDYCLLLDAEIVLAPGMIAALLHKSESEDRALVSVMARLNCESGWERLLVPPFVFFFKLLYPFASVNLPGRRTAAAAGGCILIRTAVLRQLGGFAAHRDALIDDCTLAARVKRAGHSIWLGLSEFVASRRAYPDFASFRRMVTRTAFTQLGYSTPVLLAVIVLMLLVFVVPWAAFLVGGFSPPGLIGGVTIAAMSAAYWPTVKFYRLPAIHVLSLPVAAMLFLAMTIESAISHWRGTTARWKGRSYASGAS